MATLAQGMLRSADDHVYEPPDLWLTRIDPKFKARAPRLIRQEQGDWWQCEGRTVMNTSPATNPGILYRRPEEVQAGRYFENVLKGGYDPDARVKDMDVDGVDLEVIYPTIALATYRTVDDPYLLHAILQAYNDWLADFCAAHPRRLKGIGLLNAELIPQALKELERIRKKGLVGALISVYPKEDWAYDRPEYDPLWSAAQGLGMPLSLHVASNRPGPGQDSVVGTFKMASRANRDHWLRVSLAHLIYSGVFARFPGLKVGSVEHDLGFIPHFLLRMDHVYKSQMKHTAGQAPRSSQDSIYGTCIYPDGLLPSDIFHRNVFCTFQDDPLGVQMRHLIGIDNLCWGSDYPHPEGTFPRSRQVVEENLKGVPEGERGKILGGNLLSLYGIEMGKAEGPVRSA